MTAQLSTRASQAAPVLHAPVFIARGWPQRCLTSVGLAASVFLTVYYPDRDDFSGALVGGLSALFVVPFAFAAIAKTRPLQQRATAQHARLAGLALIIGVGLGIANLVSNRLIAMLHPDLLNLMRDRWAGFEPWRMIIAEPLAEEIIFRLVLLGVIAWILSRVVREQRAVFPVALGISAFLFGVVHIIDPIPLTGAAAALRPIAVTVKSGAAGLLLGWVFWRWGLPYSFVVHGTANAVHMILAPALF